MKPKKAYEPTPQERQTVATTLGFSQDSENPKTIYLPHYSCGDCVMESKTFKISGFTARRVAVGGKKLAHVTISKDVSVLVRLDDTGGSGGSSGACLACQISKISACAKLVCPDIKAADPKASCSEEIRQCMELACRGSCRSAGASADLMILA